MSITGKSCSISNNTQISLITLNDSPRGQHNLAPDYANVLTNMGSIIFGIKEDANIVKKQERYMAISTATGSNEFCFET